MNNNPVTDTLRLAQKEEGRSTFGIFRRKRAEQYGFCLVIFRDKALLGFIPSTDITVEGDILRRYDRIGIKDGDTILSINLGPQPLEVAETLPTRDGYPRQYKLTLDICVIDPVKFAQRYVQETDPVARARTAIEGYIQQCASQWRHDDMNESLLREFAEQALTIEPNTLLGLKVLKAQKASLWMNPNRAREIELAEKRRLEEREIQTEGYLNRVRKQEEINLETLTTEEQIRIEQLKAKARREQDEIEAEAKRKQEEIEAETKRIEAIRQRAHENQLAASDLQEQISRHNLVMETTRQQFAIEEAQELHTQNIEYLKLVQKYKQQMEVHTIETAEAQHKLLMERQSWENQTQQALIAEVGKGAIPALIARIKEQIADDKSSLKGAVSDPELQYLLDILMGTRTSTTPLGIAQNKETISVSESPARASTQPEPEYKPVQAFPGVIQQKEDIIEIPDLGLRLIQTNLSEEQCQRAGIGANSTGFIIAKINEHGPAKEAQLLVADIVIELNGIQPKTIQDISNAVGSRETGSALSLCVLRGEALIETIVNNFQ